MLVVMPVVPDPPERPILARQDTEERENELEQLTGLERAVCQQSMIARGNPEDLKGAGDQQRNDGHAAPADEKNQSAAQMQKDKRRHERNVPRRQRTHSLALGLHLSCPPAWPTHSE
jgi:hypothetical protein